MWDYSSSEFVKHALKLRRFLAADKISIDEYAKNLLGQSTLLSEFDDTTAQEVAGSVPAIARDRLIDEIERVVAPCYRYPELHIGGTGPSKEAREELRRVCEIRVQAFAAALAKALASS